MTKKCEKTPTTIRLKIHTPAGIMHRHIDKVIEVKEATDWEAWARTMNTCLAAMGVTDTRIIIGFYLDLLNRLPDVLRLSLVKGIMEGYGLNVVVEDSAEEGVQSVTAGLVQRYNSLTPEGEETTPGGVILPKGEASKLVVPSANK